MNSEVQEMTAKAAEAMENREIVTLLGELIVSSVKALPKEWHKMSELEQTMYLDGRRFVSSVAAKQIVGTLAARSLDHASATIKQVAFKEESVRITLEAKDRDAEALYELADRAVSGLDVTLVLSGAENWVRGEMPPVDRDQNELEL